MSVRRLVVRWALAVVTAGALFGVVPLSPASACAHVDAETGLCAEVEEPPTVPSGEPSRPGGGSGSGGSPCPGAPNGVCEIFLEVCESGGGPCASLPVAWSSLGQCYAVPFIGAGPGDPLWDDLAGDATDGKLMSCVSGGRIFYVPPGQDAAPDPREIALRVVDRAPFEKPDLRTAPSSDIPSVIYVQNWLWMPASQWHDIEAQATVGATTVTVTGKLVRSQWDMGDGNTHTCTGPGRKWVKGMSKQEQTTCSYAYERTSAYDDGPESPDGYFTISGRLVYDVSWTCTGVCTSNSGDLGEHSGPTTTTCLTVDHIQTIVVDPRRPRDPDKARRSHCP